MVREAGRQFYGYVCICEVLGTMDIAERSPQSLLNLEQGEVRVEASPMMTCGLLLQPVADVQKACPGIRTGLHELSSDDTIDDVVNGRADLDLLSQHAPHGGPDLCAKGPGLMSAGRYQQHRSASAGEPVAGIDLPPARPGAHTCCC